MSQEVRFEQWLQSELGRRFEPIAATRPPSRPRYWGESLRPTRRVASPWPGLTRLWLRGAAAVALGSMALSGGIALKAVSTGTANLFVRHSSPPTSCAAPACTTPATPALPSRAGGDATQGPGAAAATATGQADAHSSTASSVVTSGTAAGAAGPTEVAAASASTSSSVSDVTADTQSSSSTSQPASGPSPSPTALSQPTASPKPHPTHPPHPPPNKS